VLPSVAWLLLGLWSNPYLFPFRLPYSGYLDVTTVVSGAWLPLSILGGYAVVLFCQWFLSFATTSPAQRALRYAAIALLTLTGLLVGAASGLALSSKIDLKPYLARADMDAMAWMRDHLPSNSYVLANPFAFPWDPPPQAVHGSDAGLWTPLLAGVRSSVPPIPAYNERPFDPHYIDDLREIVGDAHYGGEPDWDALKAVGITHIYVGSRGGGLSVSQLVHSDHTRLLFQEDAVWVFELR
jgi:hypothetical protein